MFHEGTQATLQSLVYSPERAPRHALEDRYKSALVEGSGKVLMTMGAYMDLNPVRAGMVSKPEDYRWCVYASGMKGNRSARRGPGRILSVANEISGEDSEKRREETASQYRLWLYHEEEIRVLVEAVEQQRRQGFSREAVEAEAKRGGEMSCGKRCPAACVF